VLFIKRMTPWFRVLKVLSIFLKQKHFGFRVKSNFLDFQFLKLMVLRFTRLINSGLDYQYKHLSCAIIIGTYTYHTHHKKTLKQFNWRIISKPSPYLGLRFPWAK
jgi:hypothetical protein